MSITVIINCHNSEKYIDETALSLSSQSYKTFKVLFIDNHSTDNSFLKFKSNSNFEIKYIKTPKFVSLYDARNYSLSFLDTEITCFLDADDMWSPDYLQKVYNIHKENPNIISLQARTFSYQEPNKFKEITKIVRKKEMIELNDFAKMPFTALGGLSIKSSFFNGYRFPNSSNFIGDLDLVLNLARKKQLYFFNDADFFYRIHPGGLTSKNLDGWKFELENWLYKKQTLLPELLFKKLSSDLKYITLRILIKKLNLLNFLKEVFISDIGFFLKLKLLIRRLINMQ